MLKAQLYIPPTVPIKVDGKVYCQCYICGKAIRLNKPIFGALHFCRE